MFEYVFDLKCFYSSNLVIKEYTFITKHTLYISNERPIETILTGNKKKNI